MTLHTTEHMAVIHNPWFNLPFRLVELFLCLLVSAFMAPVWALHFLRARLAGKPWLGSRTFMGSGGHTITIKQANGLSSRFFDHPAIAGSPVLWSIIAGRMSLVGPAPVSPKWAAEAESRLLGRLRVRPGLVNTHFIRSRVNIAFADEAETALKDAAGMGFGQKVGMLFRAVPALIMGSRQVGASEFINLFGLPMANRTRDRAVDDALKLVEGGQSSRIAFVNPACVNIAMKHAQYRNILHQSDLVYPDGIGIQLACKLTGQTLMDNLNGTDLFPLLAEKMAETGKGLFLLGGKPGVCEDMIARTRERLPNLKICGFHHGYFREEEEIRIVETINQSGADVLLVAMGVPQQELLIDRLLPHLKVGLVMGVGGLFDFISGRMPRAPIWMREIGLEWSFRLLMEPRRMWRRYLIGNIVFLWHLSRKHRL